MWRSAREPPPGCATANTPIWGTWRYPARSGPRCSRRPPGDGRPGPVDGTESGVPARRRCSVDGVAGFAGPLNPSGLRCTSGGFVRRRARPLLRRRKRAPSKSRQNGTATAIPATKTTEGRFSGILRDLPATDRWGAPLRELIYLSQRKLDNFVEPRSIVSALQRFKRFETSAIELASFALESHPPLEGQDRLSQIKKLERVIKKISPSDLQDPNLTAGQWVEFESTMSHAVLDSRYMQGTIFLSSKTSDLQEGLPRLLLHGSTDHYLGGKPRKLQLDRDVEKRRFVDDNSGGRYVTTLAHNVEHVVDALEESLSLSEPPPPILETEESFKQGVRKLLAALNKNFNPLLAVRLSGLARLTCNPIPIAPDLGKRAKLPSPLLIGTPLYVEHVHQ